MIIAAATRKGGSGKSTLLCNMAACMAESGKAVYLIDTDPQQSSTKWGNRRAKNSQLKSVTVKFETPSKKLVDSFPMLRKKYDFVLIDLPGQDSNDNRMIIRDADLIIVPFRPTQADLDTLPSVKSWFDVITKAKGAIKTLWVINEASTLTAKDKKDAELFMSAFGVKPARTVIHSRAAYKDCMSMGMGAIEMGNTKASTEISGLYTELLGIIENYPVLQDNTLYHEVIQ